MPRSRPVGRRNPLRTRKPGRLHHSLAKWDSRFRLSARQPHHRPSWPAMEAFGEPVQPVLHIHRLPHHHSGRATGAVRLRHSALRRLRGFPLRRSAASEEAGVRRAGGGSLRRHGSRKAANAPGARRADLRLRRLGHGGWLRHFLQLDLPHRGGDRRGGVVQVPRDRGRASRRILQPGAVRSVRHVFPGHRHGPGNALHRPGADGAVLLRDGRLPAHR